MEEKTYRAFVVNPQEFLTNHGHESIVELADEATCEHFKAKIVTSPAAKEGFEKLVVQSSGPGSEIHWECYVRIVERVEEEAYIPTLFRPGRMGLDKQGLKHALEERDKRDAEKKKTMTTELEERRKRKQEIVDGLLKKSDEEKK